MVCRGSLIPLYLPYGKFRFLDRSGVRLLDFKEYAVHIKKTSKEGLAHTRLAERPTTQGLVCALMVAEPCMSFEYHRSPYHAERGVRLRRRKCVYVYQYPLHSPFGRMNVRLQTWFTLAVQVCLNGLEWLGRHLDQADVACLRHDNSFPRLADVAAARRLLDVQLKTEWATDVMLRYPASLAALYAALVKHAMQHFASPDVMRFLGRKAAGQFTGEITASFKNRAEGVRVTHWVRGNSINMYGKAASIPRVETAIAKVGDFRVPRPPTDDPGGKLAWRPMRKGAADLHRRPEVSQAANERYLDALAVVGDSTPLSVHLDQAAKPVTYRSKRARPLRTGDPHDVALLAAVARGEFATSGFGNRDVRLQLHPRSNHAEPGEQRRLSARVG